MIAHASTEQSLGQQFRTQVEIAFSGLVDDMRHADLDTLLRQYLADLGTLHGQYFDGERDPSGRAWEPLKQSTIDRKGHDTILVDTERLLESLVRYNDDSVAVVEQVSEYEYRLEYGTKVPYAAVHQDGSTKKHIPARPMVGISDEVADMMMDELAAVALAKV